MQLYSSILIVFRSFWSWTLNFALYLLKQWSILTDYMTNIKNGIYNIYLAWMEQVNDCDKHGKDFLHIVSGNRQSNDIGEKWPSYFPICFRNLVCV